MDQPYSHRSSAPKNNHRYAIQWIMDPETNLSYALVSNNVGINVLEVHVTSYPGTSEDDLRQSYFTGTLRAGNGLVVHAKAGYVHCDDGPAIISNGHILYYLDFATQNNGKQEYYFIDGVVFTQEQFWNHQKNTEYAPMIFAKKFGI